MSLEIGFQKVVPITKAFEGDDGTLYIEGESSGPEIDLDKQFMTPECVTDMAEQVNKSPVPFGYYDEHQKRGVLSELGEVTEANVTPEYHMKTRVRLDKDNPAAVALWKKVQKGKQFGMSIAGKVLKPVKKTVGGVLFQGFDRIRLDHIANTTKPSWAPSLGTLVAKSLEQEGFDWETAPEYEGDLELPFSAHVEKRSKPDPQAGKWYTLAEDILKRLNQVFGWESYQEKIAETNRDVIPLKDLPVSAMLPAGAVELSADDYDKDPEGYIEKMVAEVAMEGQSEKPMDVRALAEIYERLYWMAEALSRRDEKNGSKDGKKTITRLKAAMTAVSDAMQQVLSKSQPEPLVYGEPPPESAPQPTGGTAMPGALKSFDDVDAVGQVPAVPVKTPQPSVVGGPVLTDFSQVAETVQGAKAEQEPQPLSATGDDDLDQLLTEFGGAVRKTFEVAAPVDSKRETLAHIIKAFAGEVGGRLETQRPEDERITRAVQKAVQPLQQQLEALRAELAVAKSQPVQPAPEGGEQPMVRKSLHGRVVRLKPARVVQKGDERPTFVDLVTGQGGLM